MSEEVLVEDRTEGSIEFESGLVSGPCMDWDGPRERTVTNGKDLTGEERGGLVGGRTHSETRNSSSNSVEENLSQEGWGLG